MRIVLECNMHMFLMVGISAERDLVFTERNVFGDPSFGSAMENFRAKEYDEERAFRPPSRSKCPQVEVRCWSVVYDKGQCVRGLVFLAQGITFVSLGRRWYLTVELYLVAVLGHP